jgi:hypothetical protein
MGDGDRRNRAEAPAEPPEAHRPFLDALAELLACHVVGEITGGPGSRAPRNSSSQEDPEPTP